MPSLFVLCMVSFAVQKILSLICFQLFIFAFVSFALEDRSKKILQPFMSMIVLPVLSSSFMVAETLGRKQKRFLNTLHVKRIGIWAWGKKYDSTKEQRIRLSRISVLIFKYILCYIYVKIYIYAF